MSNITIKKLPPPPPSFNIKSWFHPSLDFDSILQPLDGEMVHPSSPLQASLEVVRNLDFPFGFLYMWSWNWNYLVKQGRKLANSLFTQTFQNFANFPKLIREMPLFWNSIFGQSSYSEPKNLKKKKIETWVPRKKFKWSSNTSHGTRVSKKKKKFFDSTFAIT